MGGVDKCDMFLTLYRTKLKTRKWYHRIAIHLLSVAIVNAFVIYKEVGGKGSLLTHSFFDGCLPSIVPQLTNKVTVTVMGHSISHDADHCLQKMYQIMFDTIGETTGQYSTWTHIPANKMGVKDEAVFIARNASCTCVTGTNCFLNFHGIETA